MNIITNNHWHDFLYGYELPESVKTDFDYLDPEDLDQALFIKYRGCYYDSGEFMRIENHPDSDFSNWHGYHSDSYFSGVLVRYSDDFEQYQIATYIS